MSNTSCEELTFGQAAGSGDHFDCAVVPCGPEERSKPSAPGSESCEAAASEGNRRGSFPEEIKFTWQIQKTQTAICKNASPEPIFTHSRHTCQKTLSNKIKPFRPHCGRTTLPPSQSELCIFFWGNILWLLLWQWLRWCSANQRHAWLHRLHDGQDLSETKMIITKFLPVCQDSNMFWCYLACSNLRKTLNCWWRWITKLDLNMSGVLSVAFHLHQRLPGTCTTVDFAASWVASRSVASLNDFEVPDVTVPVSCHAFYSFSVQRSLCSLCFKASTTFSGSCATGIVQLFFFLELFN